MKWNSETGYIEYSRSLQNIKSILRISNLDYMMRCELAPYITYVIKYLDKRLILLGEDIDIKSYIQEIFDIYDWIGDKVVSDSIDDILIEMGIDKSQNYIEGEEIPYNQDRFIFSLTNVITSLVVRLKFQYSSLLVQPIDTSCPCNECGNVKGQTTEDFENWKSGVFPEDEEYDWWNFSDDGTNWRVNNKVPECTKCSRIN